MVYWVYLLMIVYIFRTTAQDSKDLDLSYLSKPVLEDIYALSNNLTLAASDILNITVTADNIKFYLFTNNNTNNYTIIDSSNASVVANKDARCLFLIHGLTENRTTFWYKLYTELFFGLNVQYNIIQVDYAPYSNLNYISACSAASQIGSIIGEFAVTLTQKHLIPIENILIVGFSLGGQIASFLGKKVQELLDQKLPRIIALDPPGPLFQNRPESEKLNSNDAAIVEVIHSSGDIFGYLRPCGTTDFFLNGGKNQPGCIETILKNLTHISETVFCAHNRSWKVFASAIQNPKHFKAKKCPGRLTSTITPLLCVGKSLYLGDISTNKTGIYYVNSTDTSPYYTT